jgi:hypothetical protein
MGFFLAADTRKLSSQEQPAPPGISRNDQGATVLRLPPGIQAKIGQQFHRATDNCATAKVDIWIQAGRVEYVVFAPDRSTDGKVETDTRQGFPAIRVGKDDCRIDVVITPSK